MSKLTRWPPLVGPARHHAAVGPHVETPSAAPNHLCAQRTTMAPWATNLTSNLSKLTVNLSKLQIQLVKVGPSVAKVDRRIFAKTARQLPTRHRGLARHCVFRRWLRWKVEGRPPQGPPRDLPPQPRRKARRGKQSADQCLRQPKANATRERERARADKFGCQKPLPHYEVYSQLSQVRNPTSRS